MLDPAGTAVLQVLPTFDDAFGGPVSAALGVSESYAGVEGISLCTVGAGRPGPAWGSYRTVARRSWSSPLGPRHTLDGVAPAAVVAAAPAASGSTSSTCTTTAA